MGDEDGGRVRLALDTANLAAHIEAQPRIEIGQRLVEQEHVGTADESPGQRHTLLLAARHVGRAPVEQGLDLQKPGKFLDQFVDRGVVDAAQLQREGDVLIRRHVGIQRVGLEDDADIALLGREVRHVPLADQDTPAIRLQDAGDGEQRRGLAAARGTEQGQHLALFDGKAHVGHGDEAAETLGEMFEPDAHQPFVPPP